MTEFVGSFNWDEANKKISGFTGTMNESMRGNWATGHEYDGTPQFSDKFMMPLASDGGADYNQTAVNGLAMATVYRLPGDDTVFGAPLFPGAVGTAPSPNTENASFKLVFEYDQTTGTITSTGLQNAYSSTLNVGGNYLNPAQAQSPE